MRKLVLVDVITSVARASREQQLTMVDIVTLVVSGLALLASGFAVYAAFRQATLTRHANSLPALVDMFREHRGERLSQAREYVYRHLPPGTDLSRGLDSIGNSRMRRKVLDLMWFYDNLGVLVVHGIVDPKPVSGYLGSSAQSVWHNLKPLILAERMKRSSSTDPGRWQHYFELLVEVIERNPPAEARAIHR